MSDGDFERFSAGNDATLRAFVRSSLLDRPQAGARERVLERVLAGEPRKPRSFRVGAGIGLAAGLCVGAAAVLFVAASAGRKQPPTTLVPEALQIAPAPSASALPAGSSSTPRPTVPPRASPPLPPCPRVVVAAGREPLLDDFEDGNARLFIAEGRAGTWRTNAPPGTKLSPPPGALAFPIAIPQGRGDSKKALRLTAQRFKEGAASLVADLAPPRGCYDASVYAGVSFFARGRARIGFRVTMIDAMEKRWGGLCEARCYDSHAKWLDSGADFRRYEIRWSELEQAGWGTAVPFDPRRILNVDFSVDAADSPFEVWIDDVRFLQN
ncbi:MAG TPA: hypothetical protein VF103_12695 [Polyangiaceae bacterium]